MENNKNISASASIAHVHIFYICSINKQKTYSSLKFNDLNFKFKHSLIYKKSINQILSSWSPTQRQWPIPHARTKDLNSKFINPQINYEKILLNEGQDK